MAERVLKELFSTLTIIALVLVALILVRIAAFSPRLALAVLLILLAFAAIMVLSFVLRLLRNFTRGKSS
ncbi:MAG: hypothetical protein ABDH61_00850 [Acidilobaceae archaeon]